jgi:hypothetical protein
MNQSETELVIEWFVDLESWLKKYLKMVPITWNHNAVLPLLSGIIVEAGGLVDSVFRKEYDLSQSSIQRKNLKITHFAAQYEQRYELSSKTTVIYQYPPVLLNPFFSWAPNAQGAGLTLDWWDAYNKLKHEKIEHYAKSTLSNAATALCALHQVLSVLPCFFRSLISHDMVALGGYGVPYAIEAVEQGLTEMPFLVDSELFATPYAAKRFPADLDDVSSVAYGGSRRLAQFLGR